MKFSLFKIDSPKIKSIALLLLLCFSTAWSQTKFEAKVSRKTLGLNERLRVDFTMNEDGDTFRPPDFEGFRIVGGPNQSVSMSWLNSEKTFNKTYSYYLTPIRKGKLVIPQSSIEINGKTYYSSPITVVVTDAIEKPKDPNQIEFSASEHIHLVSEISKTSPYINEPITVVHKLYVSSKISIRNWREISFPKFQDFWSQDIDIKDLKIEKTFYKGEEYRYVVLRKNILYPQKIGKLTIEPLSLDISVELPTNKRDFFGGMITTTDNQTFSTTSKTIHVKPLPTKNRPTDFSGAVGRFDFVVKPSKTRVKHGESLDLDVRVSGEGNLKLFNIPEPLIPSSLEVYDPISTEKVTTTADGLKGYVGNKYTIIPQFQGNFPIRPLSFNYFDIKTGTYKTILSNEVIIDVIDGPNSLDRTVASGNGSINGSSKTAVPKTAKFKYIKSDTQLNPVDSEDFLGSELYILLVSIPLCFIPLLILFKKRKEKSAQDVFGNKTRQSERLAKKYLSEAKKNITNEEQFYISLEKSLHNFMKAKLHIEASDMQKDTIKSLLEDKNIIPEDITSFMDLIENCELARYTPTTSVTIKNDYDKAVKTLLALGKQI